jgi:hypothetical protein
MKINFGHSRSIIFLAAYFLTDSIFSPQFSTGLMEAADFSPRQQNAVAWRHLPTHDWARLYLRNSLFPHFSRNSGRYYAENSADSSTRKFFPLHPHYDDSSVFIFTVGGMTWTA